MYLEQDGRRYDASLWLTPEGNCAGVAKMVHIMQAAQFYERDYYTPSEEGFLVFGTPWGRVGIVICFDRHLPESIRTCALKVECRDYLSLVRNQQRGFLFLKPFY